MRIRCFVAASTANFRDISSGRTASRCWLAIRRRRNSESRSRPILVRRSNVVAEGRAEGLVAVVELDGGRVNM
jgi:hypothetical protein